MLESARGVNEMHPTFEKFLEPIRDKSLPIGERSFYASREMLLTNQANEVLKSQGDIEGVKFGEEYLRILRELIANGGLKVHTR
jgi:hypothetical protein